MIYSSIRAIYNKSIIFIIYQHCQNWKLALQMIAYELDNPLMRISGLRPILVLITDKHLKDDFDEGIMLLNKIRWGRETLFGIVNIGWCQNKLELKHLGFKVLMAGDGVQLVKQVIKISHKLVGRSISCGVIETSPINHPIAEVQEFIPDTDSW
jgi:hypothetical protein